jgi:hypothetical protein
MVSIEATDGLVWGNRQVLFSDAGKIIYPTILDPTTPEVRSTGSQFWIYYIYTPTGQNRREL